MHSYQKNLKLDYQNFNFTINNRVPHSKARCGIISTPHGNINTPAFIFCATKACMKAMSISDAKKANTQVILSNTYHMMIQPGSYTIEKMGGLHKFMGWNGPMLTDSGGFQIFSLGHGLVADEIKGKRNTGWTKTLLHINDNGAVFRSYLDGKKHLLTPEISIQIQKQLGADLVVMLDECTPFHVDKNYTERSMITSHYWGDRSIAEFYKLQNGSQALYGISQGGVYPDLRKISCEYLNARPFFGHAIGGSLGASKDQMYEVIDIATENLCMERPIHLLGIGGIKDIFRAVEYGIDTFDCVHPTRLARHGGALVKSRNLRRQGEDKPEHINLRNAIYTFAEEPIEKDCVCDTCINHSCGYIHHLLKAKEILAHNLITTHNVFFMNALMEAIRSGIKDNCLNDVRRYWIETD